MSLKETVTFTCPNCGEEHPFEIWKSINTSSDRKIKQKIKDRSVFLFSCPSCGEKSYTDYGLLYHQPEEQIMIYYAPTDEEAEESIKLLSGQEPSDMFQEYLEGDYLNRIVRSQNELIEKIAIFDAGLDDRIIEIYKLLVWSTYLKQNPDCFSAMVFFFSLEGQNYIEIIADGVSIGSAVVQEELYQKLETEFADKISDIRKDVPVIDRKWALETMKK